MKNVFYFTNIFPHYRKTIWSLLLNENNYNFEIFYSNKPTWGIKSTNLEELNFEMSKIHILKNYFLFGRIIWQSTVLKTLFSKNYEIVFFTGEMSIISTWIGALVCRMFKKKVVFWGHGIYGNEGRIKKFFRILFLKLPHTNLVYENRAKQLLIKEGIRSNKIKVIYNSLDYDLQLKLFQNLESKPQSEGNHFNNKLPIVIFVGRLSKTKKINLLIESIAMVNSKSPKVNMLIVGDGPEKSRLELIAKNDLSDNNYKFLGAIYDETELSKLFYYSKVCISPGNIGLTGIHSLSYGTPVGSHNNFFNQMPEVEVIDDKKNGFLFEEDNIIELSKKITSWINKNNNKNEIRNIIDLKYNPHFQKSIFDSLIIDND